MQAPWRFAAAIVGLTACGSDFTQPLPEVVAILVGAGDIASCESDGDEATAALLDTIPGIVFTAGDNVYPSGTAAQFADCYTPTWGRHLDRTHPSPGNHDMLTDAGGPYFDYFGARAGPDGRGYYRFEAGEWAVIALDSNADVSVGSPQHAWLVDELQRISAPCVLAYWHHPRFSSGPHGDHPRVAAAWQALHAAGADVILAGHDHTYERFAPQDASGQADPAGIRQFVVGTGGRSLYSFTRVAPNSEMRIDSTFGVLRLALRPDTYEWSFIAIDGNVLDQGSGRCR